MLNLDISNVWTCVSLPELLGAERELFEAHNLLRTNVPEGPDFQGWLSMSENLSARLIHSIRRRAEQICTTSQVLVVCGSGAPFHGARAAIDCYCGSGRNLLNPTPRILFVGDSLSSRQWLELSHLLEDQDYSLHLISADGKDLACSIAARGLRWMLERKYGPKAKERVSVATLVGSPMHKMAQEEGYELFPMPRELGGRDSTLTAAAMVPMAAAGMDPLDFLEGAVEACRELDIRSFDNPAWLYAGVRSLLPGKGKKRELLCLCDHSLSSFGRWWQRYVWQHEGLLGPSEEVFRFPGDLEYLDDVLSGGKSDAFETVIRFDPIAKKVPVEMDWKDYDGLGFLSGRNLDYVEEQTLAAMTETHNFAGVPVLDLQAGELTAEVLGQLFTFFELSASLTSCLLGGDPFAKSGAEVRKSALSNMGAPRV